MRVTIALDAKGPAGKVADAELHFEESEGPLEGLKLIGFSVWKKRDGAGYNITVPARSYSVNGERRSFGLLRPTGALEQMDALRAVIIDCYEQTIADRLSEQG